MDERQISEMEVAREFRRLRCRGSVMDALANPVMRHMLEVSARIHAEREASRNKHQPDVLFDGKRSAANDIDKD